MSLSSSSKKKNIENEDTKIEVTTDEHSMQDEYDNPLHKENNIIYINFKSIYFIKY